MTPTEKEEFYDKEIAPKLMELCHMCQDRGMAFVAKVEFDPLNMGTGRTEFMPEDTQGKLSASQRITHWAARCNGNVDALIYACIEHGREHGHGSVYLQTLINQQNEWQRRIDKELNRK